MGSAIVRKSLITVALFSFAVNTLILAVPIYLFQISDRVLTSRSMDTLVMLTIVVVIALVMHVLVDIVRRIILMRTAVEVESKLGPAVLSAAAKASQNGSAAQFQVLGDLQQLRAFITGPVLLTMLDAPVTPLYLLAVFLVHPYLGFIVGATGLILLVHRHRQPAGDGGPFSLSNTYGMRANLQADAMARNAGVLNAMGMVPEAVQIWGRETRESLKTQVLAQDRNILLAGVSKLIRLMTQIGLLGVGAWLAVRGRPDRRHDDRRVDRRQPRPRADRGNHRGLAQFRAGAQRRTPASAACCRARRSTSIACACRGRTAC